MLNPMQLYNNIDKDRPVSNIGYVLMKRQLKRADDIISIGHNI